MKNWKGQSNNANNTISDYQQPQHQQYRHFPQKRQPAAENSRPIRPPQHQQQGQRQYQHQGYRTPRHPETLSRNFSSLSLTSSASASPSRGRFHMSSNASTSSAPPSPASSSSTSGGPPLRPLGRGGQEQQHHTANTSHETQHQQQAWINCIT